MDVPELMAAMAAHLETIPGIASAYAVPPNVIDEADLPAIVLFWDETTVLSDTDGYMWLPTIRGQVLVSRRGDTPEELSTVWSLVTPVTEAFGVVPINSVLSGIAAHVDRIIPSQERPTQPSGLIEYAGLKYLGAEISWGAKFHRYDEELP